MQTFCYITSRFIWNRVSCVVDIAPCNLHLVHVVFRTLYLVAYIASYLCYFRWALRFVHGDMQVPRCRTLTRFHLRAGPSLWNSLPPHLIIVVFDSIKYLGVRLV